MLICMAQKMKNSFSLDNYWGKAKDYQRYEKIKGAVIQYISQGKEKIVDFDKTALYNQKYNLSEEKWKNIILDNFDQNNFCMNLLMGFLNIIEYYKINLVNRINVEFNWSFPDWLLKDKNKYILYGENDDYYIGKVLYDYYLENCLD